MNQPVPNVGPEDVQRVVNRDYPLGDRPQVDSLLREFEADSPDTDCTRALLAALKLADSDISRLEAELATARADSRDVIAPAEYPSYLALDKTATRQQIEMAIESDRAQYCNWLGR